MATIGLDKLYYAKITEDALHKYQKELQDSTDAVIKQIDSVLEEKEKEIMNE